MLNAKANLHNPKNLDLRVMDMLQSMLKGINVVTKTGYIQAVQEFKRK
ncbi:hypothetical protein [Methanobacterium lacus]|nr:hypothetical protein [Methanobacterium lacus]